MNICEFRRFPEYFKDERLIQKIDLMAAQSRQMLGERFYWGHSTHLSRLKKEYRRELVSNNSLIFTVGILRFYFIWYCV